MKPSQLVPLLARLMQAREPFILTGRPGIGKTDMTEQAAAQAGVHHVTWHPVTADPTDAKGLPAIIGERAEFLPTAELRAVLEATEPTFVLMDDLGQAPPAVQAAYMHLWLARRINGFKIPECVTFGACTNRRQDNAAVTGVISPLIDRATVVIEAEVDVEDWVSWGLAHEMPSELLAFARFRPAFVTEHKATREIVKTPSPRSLAGIGRMMRLGLRSLDVLSAGAGQAFGVEFHAFLDTLHLLPDVKEILANPKKAPVPEEGRPDLLYAIAGALVGQAAPPTMDAIMTYGLRFPREFTILLVKDCVRKDRKLAESPAFVKFVSDPRNAGLIGLSE